jgi:hypothetical protein
MDIIQACIMNKIVISINFFKTLMATACCKEIFCYNLWLMPAAAMSYFCNNLMANACCKELIL